MPKYFYVCTNCKNEFSFYHSMSEGMTDCPGCERENVLNKVPSTFFFDGDKNNINEGKTGEGVKKSIESSREDLEYEKNKLKSELYEPNK